MKFLVAFSAVMAVAAAQTCIGFTDSAADFATVGYKEKNFRGEVLKEVTRAEVKWVPQEMLDDVACYNLGETALLYKTSNMDAWEEVDARQRAAGKSSKWLVDVKPCLEYTFAIRVTGDNGEAQFELPGTVGPASQEEIIDSGFIPDAPSALTADVGAGSATLDWEAADCAARYEVAYAEVGKNEFKYSNADSPTLEVSNLTPCTNYEITINALLTAQSDDFSDDYVANFATRPRLDAAKELDATVTATMNTATVTWEAYKASCINEYQVEVCAISKPEQDCKPTQVIKREAGVPTMTFEATDLEPCTDYNFKLLPIYPGINKMEEKMISFKTLTPSADSLKVASVNAVSVGSGKVNLDWSAVNCAMSYKIFRKETAGDKWTEAGETTDTNIPLDSVTPCTEFVFAVSAVIGQDAETDKTSSASVISDLDPNTPFDAPGLIIDNADRSANIAWDHAVCIESYVIKVCQEAYTDCTEIPVAPEGKQINQVIADLEPCTEYSLEVVPVITGKVFTARTKEFTTTNGTPAAPAAFKAQLTAVNRIDAEWKRVQCATGYKVYVRSEGSDEETVTEISAPEQTGTAFKNLVPCQTYYYSVATIVGEQESERTETQSLVTPPLTTLPPILKIVNNENDNMTLRLEAPAANRLCESVGYEVSYSSTGREPYESQTYETGVPEGDIFLSFVGASGLSSIVQGKIMYTGGAWSDIASSREPGDMSQMQSIPSDSSLLVPVVIGAMVALVVALVLIGFCIRKRRARDNYDAEKADTKAGPDDETRKLNEAHPDA